MYKLFHCKTFSLWFKYFPHFSLSVIYENIFGWMNSRLPSTNDFACLWHSFVESVKGGRRNSRERIIVFYEMSESKIFESTLNSRRCFHFTRIELDSTRHEMIAVETETMWWSWGQQKVHLARSRGTRAKLELKWEN